MGYNHYRFARRVGAGIQLKSTDVASYPAIDLQDAGSIVLRALTGSGKVYVSLGAGHALAFYVNSGDGCIDSVTADQNIFLKPNGSGLVKFGTKTGTGDTATDGYISILDSAGGAVKLATVA